MDYLGLLDRSWRLIWSQKFLIVLGIIVALGGSGASQGVSQGSRSIRPPQPRWSEPLPPEWKDFEFAPLEHLDLPAVPVIAIVLLGGVVLILALAIWVVTILARGALVAGAGAADAGEATGFGIAFRRAWNRALPLVGIALLPAVPALIVTVLGTAVVLTLITGGVPGMDGMVGGWVALAAMLCMALPFFVLLTMLRNFADRACVLDECGVLDAYRRGFKILSGRIGPAVVLLLIQFAIGLFTGLVLIAPSLCCIVWPLLLVVNGAATAFYSTMWTLAWREWTGVPVEAAALR